MNFLNLRYFSTVAETQNFTSAAAALGISQQALSGHIAKLEKYFGLALFDRTPPLRLTEAGHRLHESACRMLDLKKTTERELQDIKDFRGGELTIGATNARAAFILPELLTEFHAMYPQTRLHLVEGNSPEIREALYKGKIDLSIGFEMDDPEHVRSYFLQNEDSLIVVPEKIFAEHFRDRPAPSGKKPVTLDMFTGCPFITMKPTTWAGSIFESCCRENNIAPRVVLEVGNIMTLITLCVAGMGIIICPRIFLVHNKPLFKLSLRRAVRLFRLDYEPAHRQITVNILRNRRQTRAMRNFIAMAREFYRA